MKLKILGLLLSIFLGACSEKETLFEFEKVQLLEENSSVKFNDFFSSIDFIELEFDHDEVLIGNIDRYQIVGKYIFLMDEAQGKKIVKFDLEGNFIDEITSVDDGPRGFNSPYTFSVSESKNELVVLDRTMMKLIVYDMNFNFISSEKLEMYFSNIAHLKDNNLLFFPDDIIIEKNGYVLAYRRANGNLASILHTKHKLVPFSMEPIFFNNHSQIFHVPMEEKFFLYDNNIEEFKPMFQIIYDKESIPSKLLKSTDIYELNLFIQESKKRCCAFNGMERNNYYYFFYHRGLENHGLAKINKSELGDNISVSWDTMFSKANVPVPFGSGEDFFYSVGYMDKKDHNKVAKIFGKNPNEIEFPDFKEKLFLFKFYLK